MKETDIIRLRHMLDAAHEALSFAAGSKREIWITIKDSF